MSIKTMLLARFWNDRRASVAPLLALTIIPLMGAVGAAVDYTRVNAAKAALQTAIDSTALLLSKTAATQTNAELQAAATAAFNGLFHADATGAAVTASYSSSGGSMLKLTGTATVATSFLGVFGYNSVPIGASATSTWGNTRLRVALVLDNTGSMSSDDKMTALKTASQNLLTQLKDAVTDPEDVYVSIIPFSKDVNVGADNVGAPWLRWDLWEAENGSCSNWRYSSQRRCASHDEVWTPAAHSAWNGCVTDRDQNFDTTNDEPVAGGTLYPAEQYESCPVSMMGLSNDWTALSAKVEAMQPAGNTNQAIGLQMGWQSLTASPFTIPEKDPEYKYKQVIILLSDGLNTEDRWYGWASPIDTRQEAACTNVKAAGITIYAVQVNTGGDATSTVLQNCASDPSKFFLLTSATQIVTTFGEIGTALSNLRLSM
jgi:Flp pilus assembly protein TadG